ncbi:MULTISPECIES: hypothetical protein [Streptosporangium]|uniref:Restriction endonuclease domain-containing protein n=1 Tax=Streptosporangium brasiliense TaxID=47480 RepID=A0ABT9R577_9ACTN|nr:hypothetical protein [Streptosporangium brasiliense]MDP9864037.1 hypothetical protein [Streptosporangium brasiliense]
MERAVHTEKGAVDRLAQLGLKVEEIHAALNAGVGESRTWSEDAPVAMAGMARWGRINEHLRISKSKHEWRAENPRNLPLTIHPTGAFAIVATTGDAQTGSKTGAPPTTKYAKGATYQKVVQDNGQVQLPLFVDAEVGPVLHDIAAEQPRATWVLLYYVTERAVFVELSLPGSITEQGYVDYWRERILIPPYVIESVSVGSEEPREGEQGVDVAVERR